MPEPMSAEPMPSQLPESQPSEPLLSIQEVTKSFGEHQVLKGISLDVAPHDVVCLIGSSGSGKSTLLKCIELLEPVDDGGIVFDGVDITMPAVDVNRIRTRIGIVFQSYNLFPHLTVLHNITLAPRKVRGESKREAERHGLELLARFGLADKAGDYPDRLSGGQQQRVAVVRALAMDPELMLFDEVTSALDPELVDEVLEIIRELKASGLTMIIATHEMAFARDIADTICFLDDGRILEQGPPSEVFANPRHERTAQFLRRVLVR